MNLIDMIIVFIILVSSLYGYSRGMVRTLFNLVSYGAALIIAKVYYNPLSQWLGNSKFFMMKIEGMIASYVDKSLVTTVAETPGTSGYSQWITSMEWPDFIEKYLLSNLKLQYYGQQTMELVKSAFIRTLQNLFLNLISIILLFCVAKIFIIALGFILDRVFDMPVLSTVNQMGGLVLGIVRGGLISLFIILLLLVITVASPGGNIATVVDQSLIIEFFTTGNYMNFLQGL